MKVSLNIFFCFVENNSSFFTQNVGFRIFFGRIAETPRWLPPTSLMLCEGALSVLLFHRRRVGTELRR